MQSLVQSQKEESFSSISISQKYDVVLICDFSVGRSLMEQEVRGVFVDAAASCVKSGARVVKLFWL